MGLGAYKRKNIYGGSIYRFNNHGDDALSYLRSDHMAGKKTIVRVFDPKGGKIIEKLGGIAVIEFEATIDNLFAQLKSELS